MVVISFTYIVNLVLFEQSIKVIKESTLTQAWVKATVNFHL